MSNTIRYFGPSFNHTDPPERPPAPTFPDDPHPIDPGRPNPAPEPTPSLPPDVNDPIPPDTHW
jgi:hypothetical protein